MTAGIEIVGGALRPDAIHAFSRGLKPLPQPHRRGQDRRYRRSKLSCTPSHIPGKVEWTSEKPARETPGQPVKLFRTPCQN